MEWLLIVLVLAVVAVSMARRSDSSTARPAKERPIPPPSLADIESQMMRGVEAEAAQMMREVEAEASRLHAETIHDPEPDPPTARGVHDAPSWMSSEAWQDRLVAYRRQGRSDEQIAEVADFLEKRGPRQPRTREQLIARSTEIGIVTRAVYVPKEDEVRYLTRDSDGLPTLRLVDAGDRLAIWSPLDGGELINPKGPGLRSLGLYSSYARGSQYHASAYRTADLRRGRWVELRREPDNPHDKNAVAMHAPGARAAFAYVQKGRAPAIARRMDAGEDMAGVTLWGPGRGRDDDDEPRSRWEQS